ncbi:MAG: hypothetical protein ACC628_08250 [Pirellulaceae bacterium]
MHNVELWSRHFAEHTPAYCTKVRRAIERAGSTLCNIQMDEPYRHVTYDIGQCVKLGESMGFKGIYSVEQWAPAYIPPDPFKTVQAIIADVAAAL